MAGAGENNFHNRGSQMAGKRCLGIGFCKYIILQEHHFTNL